MLLIHCHAELCFKSWLSCSLRLKSCTRQRLWLKKLIGRHFLSCRALAQERAELKSQAEKLHKAMLVTEKASQNAKALEEHTMQRLEDMEERVRDTLTWGNAEVVSRSVTLALKGVWFVLCTAACWMFAVKCLMVLSMKIMSLPFVIETHVRFGQDVSTII